MRAGSVGSKPASSSRHCLGEVSTVCFRRRACHRRSLRCSSSSASRAVISTLRGGVQKLVSGASGGDACGVVPLLRPELHNLPFSAALEFVCACGDHRESSQQRALTRAAFAPSVRRDIIQVVYVLSGTGTIEDMTSGESMEVHPGVSLITWANSTQLHAADTDLPSPQQGSSSEPLAVLKLQLPTALLDPLTGHPAHLGGPLPSSMTPLTTREAQQLLSQVPVMRAAGADLLQRYSVDEADSSTQGWRTGVLKDTEAVRLLQAAHASTRDAIDRRLAVEGSPPPPVISNVTPPPLLDQQQHQVADVSPGGLFGHLSRSIASAVAQQVQGAVQGALQRVQLPPGLAMPQLQHVAAAGAGTAPLLQHTSNSTASNVSPPVRTLSPERQSHHTTASSYLLSRVQALREMQLQRQRRNKSSEPSDTSSSSDATSSSSSVGETAAAPSLLDALRQGASTEAAPGGCILMRRAMEEFKAFRFPKQTNQLAFVFDPAELGLSLSFGVEVFEPGHHTPLHVHRTGHELFFVLAGEGDAFCDGVHHPVRAGDVIVFPPGSLHGLDNNTPHKLYTLQMMCPDDEFVAYVQSGELVGKLDDEDICQLTASRC